MSRIALAASAAAVLLASGCGGQPTPPDRSAPAISTTTTSGGTPARTSGSIVVTQQGTAPAKTLWYLRVEDPTAKPLLEMAFPNRRIALNRDFPAGNYRVIVWYRPCESTCPTTGESALGALQQVCGAQVQLTAGQQTNATATINSDTTCTVKVSA